MAEIIPNHENYENSLQYWLEAEANRAMKLDRIENEKRALETRLEALTVDRDETVEELKRIRAELKKHISEL
ncbi:hypothetical protein [Fibrobacter sp.]|uniref:hypothetical protein n=1 Tax=Fibrobacter sp. TaxID=35828 RepID=UPI0038909F68